MAWFGKGSSGSNDDGPQISEGETYTCIDCPKSDCRCSAAYSIPFGAVIPAKKICPNCVSGTHI